MNVSPAVASQPRTTAYPTEAAWLDEVSKSQYVRLIDIFLLGPACIIAAKELPKERPLLRAFFAIAGIGTIYYNARNYAAIEKAIGADPSGQLRQASWNRLP